MGHKKHKNIILILPSSTQEAITMHFLLDIFGINNMLYLRNLIQSDLLWSNCDKGLMFWMKMASRPKGLPFSTLIKIAAIDFDPPYIFLNKNTAWRWLNFQKHNTGVFVNQNSHLILNDFEPLRATRNSIVTNR